MNLYWVVIYPLHMKFPFSDWKTASRFYELANTYHPYEVEMFHPGE